MQEIRIKVEDGIPWSSAFNMVAQLICDEEISDETPFESNTYFDGKNYIHVSFIRELLTFKVCKIQ